MVAADDYAAEVVAVAALGADLVANSADPDAE